MKAEPKTELQKSEENLNDRKRERESIPKAYDETKADDTVSVMTCTNQPADEHKKEEAMSSKKKKKHPIHAEVVINPCCIIPFQSLRAEVEKFIRASFEPSFMVSFPSQNLHATFYELTNITG